MNFFFECTHFIRVARNIGVFKTTFECNFMRTIAGITWQVLQTGNCIFDLAIYIVSSADAFTVMK